MSLQSTLFFWIWKSPEDNAWHPQPNDHSSSSSSSSSTNPKFSTGSSSSSSPLRLPFLQRANLEATSVDVAPFIAGAGALAHISQLHSFGFTASASIFRNERTMKVMHRVTLGLVPLCLALQEVGFEYRDYIPRWAHERERGRVEVEVRRHVGVGMAIGAGVWFARVGFGWFGRRFWAPVEVVVGGALADLMHREYVKTHGLEY